MSAELETWEANGRVCIRKVDRNGNLEPVMVNRGRRIQLTEEERRLNQLRAASEEMDPFANGTLSPVRLVEGSEAAEAILSNPNHVTEDDMRELLSGHHKTFEKRLNEFVSPYILRRMIDMAENDDEVEVSTKRMQAIKDRLKEVSHDVEVVELERPLG